jgi:hypothetical protein
VGANRGGSSAAAAALATAAKASGGEVVPARGEEGFIAKGVDDVPCLRRDGQAARWGADGHGA